ncbi:unnamed protein product [Sphagnum balticum]
MIAVVIIAWLCCVGTLAVKDKPCANRTGILMNGHNGGTQLFDPYHTDNTDSNLELGLPSNGGAFGTAAVISEHLAYFAGGSACK